MAAGGLGELVRCYPFVFLGHEKIPNSKISSSDTETVGLGTFPFLSKESWGGGIYHAYDKDLQLYHTGGFCVILCM